MGLSQNPPGHHPFAGSARMKPRSELADSDGLTVSACLLQWEPQTLGWGGLPVLGGVMAARGGVAEALEGLIEGLGGVADVLVLPAAAPEG
ncbi:hypothetical protein WJX77_008318 [Trebouxia sp. C0004]